MTTPPTHHTKKHSVHEVPASPVLYDNTHKKNTTSINKRVWYTIGFAVWVVVAFMAAQLIVFAAAWMIVRADISLPFILNETVLQTIVSVVVYALAIAIAVGVPWKLFSQRLTWSDVGLAQSLPRWRDIGLAPIAFILSLVATGVAMYIASLVIPGVDLDTKQQVGFENLSQRYEMLLAFFTLVVLAPLCEEFLFRGYLYGRIRKYMGAVWTVALTSLVFGAMHVYAGPGMPLQWNVMIGTVVLALFIGSLREYTGSIWAGILVHMLKNGVAFFVLFVAPLLGVSLVQ